MKTYRKILELLLCAALILVLAACSKNTGTNSNSSEPKEEPRTEVATYPLTVTDMIGREVTIGTEPQRIVSGYYISSSACIALGLTDRIVAIEQGAAKRPIYGLAAASLIDIPNVGTAKEFDLETCLAVEPDLVILPMKQKDTAETLTSMGIPAIVVVPETHDQLIEMIELIAKATDCVDRSNEILRYFGDKMDMVNELASKVNEADKPVVYMGGTGSYLTTAPKGMYQSALIASVGAKAGGADIEGSSWTEISYEQLLAINPDIIVVPTNSQANGAPDYTVETVLADEQLSDITAVREGRVYQMTYGFEAWDSPVPSGVLGTLWMLKTVHPELMSEEEFVKEVQDFYEKFYGFVPAEESIN